MAKEPHAHIAHDLLPHDYAHISVAEGEPCPAKYRKKDEKSVKDDDVELLLLQALVDQNLGEKRWNHSKHHSDENRNSGDCDFFFVRRK